MKTKKTKSIFFLFLFSSIFLLSISPFSINAKAIISTDDLTIKSNWLYTSMGAYADKDPEDWKTNIKYNIGGKDVHAFENYGIVSYDDTEILFKSTVQFGFEVNIYLDVDYQDIYPNIDEEKEHTLNFFTIHNRGYFDISLFWEHYDVSYKYMDKGSVYRTHEYDGFIPITVAIQDITPPSGSISLNGISFDIPSYTYDIVEVRVDNVRDGEAGAMEDTFTNAGEITEGTVVTEYLNEGDTSGEQQAVKDKINEWELRWTYGPIIKSSNTQNWKKDTEPEGVAYSTITYDQDTPLIFNAPVTLRPEVYQYTQKNTYRTAAIDYNVVTGDVTSVWRGPTTKLAPERIVAIHTVNPFIHIEYVVDVTFYANVPSTAELTEAILGDPYLKRGDMIWDTDFTGDYDVTAIFAQYDPIQAFFDYVGDLLFGSFGAIITMIITIIILVVGLYIFIKIGIPYIRIRQRRKEIGVTSKYNK